MMISTLPEGFSVRPTVMDDATAVFDMITASDIALYGAPEPGYTLDDLLSDWQAPGHDMATDNWVVISPQERIVGAAYLWYREDYVRFHTHPTVHPDFTGLSIGRVLFQIAEQRARQLIAEVPPHTRITLNSGVDSIDQVGKHRLEREGYLLVRHNWRMEIEMQEAPPTPCWSEGIVIRSFVLDQDEVLVFNAVEEAFRDHWGHLPGNFSLWKHWMIEREDFDPSLWFLAWAGNEIAGVSLCEYQTEDVGWVDDLAVRRPWRRQGLGIALLYHSFGEFYKRGTRRVGLGVDSQNLTGATRLYERVGMHATRQYDSYEKELRAGVELSTQSLNV
jgi:mycothiol synthase